VLLLTTCLRDYLSYTAEQYSSMVLVLVLQLEIASFQEYRVQYRLTVSHGPDLLKQNVKYDAIVQIYTFMVAVS